MIDAAIIFLVTICLYFPTLKYEYVLDDIEWIKTMRVKHAKGTRQAFIKLLPYGCGAFLNPKYDHAVTVVLTAILGCCINWAFGSFWVALLYVVHPANHQINIWMNGRRYQVSLILGLLAMTFPAVGGLLYPLAVWVHPIAMPLYIAAWVLEPSLLLLTWIAPAILVYPRLKNWIRSRYTNSPEPARWTFHPGKLVMAVKNLKEYWLRIFWCPDFIMYHPERWGVSEVPEQRQKAFALNKGFYISVLTITLGHGIVYLLDPTALKWFLIADMCILPWLGALYNPLQYWAPRYAALFNIFALIGVGQIVGGSYILAAIVWQACVTHQNLPMYQNLMTYLWWQVIHQPNNINAAWSAINGFNRFAIDYAEEGKKVHAVTNRILSDAIGFYWCNVNTCVDFIHRHMRNRLGMNKKT